MALSKQDIDALVDGMRRVGDNGFYRAIGGQWISPWDLREEMYLSAGLTAEGERKPERVRCWLHEFNGSTIMGVGEKGPIDHGGMGCRYLSGYFVPDGAE